MAISLRAVGTTTAAAGVVTGVTAGVPAGLTATDLSILTVEIKGLTAGTAPTITTPSGWTLIGTVTNNGTLVSGVDTGSNTVGMYYRVGTYTAPTITTTGADSMGAGIVAYATSTGGTWNVANTTTGSDTASGTNASITGAANITLATGDWVIVGVGASGDIGSVTAETLTSTGATIGTRVNRINLGVTTGNDSRLLVSDWPVTAGTSTAAPVYTYTNASATTAHARFLRIREIAPPRTSLSTISDSFDSGIGAIWTVNGPVTSTGGRAQITCDVGYNGIQTASTYTIGSSAIFARLFPPSNSGTAATLGMSVNSATAGTSLSIIIDAVAGTLKMSSETGYFDGSAVSLTYDPSAHAFCQIRESAGTVFWETSPTGVAGSWTTRRSAASPAWIATDSQNAQFTAHRDTGTTDVAEVDNFNVAGSAPPGQGTATGNTTCTGAASGKRTPKATAVGATTWVGTAVGKRTPKATATGTLTFSGTAAGKRTPKATATGTTTYTGSAVGSNRGPLGPLYTRATFGAFAATNSTAGHAALEATVGAKFKRYVNYQNMGTGGTSNFPQADATWCAQTGHDLAIAWDISTSGPTFAQILSGANNASLDAFFQACKAHPGTVSIRMWWEMNDPNGPTKVDNASSTLFASSNVASRRTEWINAWRYVYNRCKTTNAATNVDFLWCPNGSDTGATTMEQLYPGDAYVDSIGVDTYNETTYGPWRSFDDRMTDLYARIKSIAPTKPVRIGEISTVNTGGPAGESKATWFEDLFLSELFPDLVSVDFFHADHTSTGGNNWTLTETPQSTAVFTEYLSTPSGVATGTTTYTGSATGKRTPKATAVGSTTFVGTAVGKRTPKATATGNTTWAGSAVGKRAPKATATGATTFVGSAVGKRVSSGTATGSTTFVGAATGKRTPKASATGATVFVGTAVGLTVRQGSATGATTWTGTATGTRAPKATATGATTWTGTAAGKRTPKATGLGSTTWTGSAIGFAPVVGSKNGSATGSTVWTGTAAGRRVPKATAAGATVYAGTAIGRSVPKATATGATVWVGSATGTAPVVGSKTGTATGLTTWVGTATGRRNPKASATGATAWAGSAVGTAPLVGGANGSAVGLTRWTGTAVGRRAPRATAVGLTLWTGAAVGRGIGESTPVAFAAPTETLTVPAEIRTTIIGPDRRATIVDTEDRAVRATSDSRSRAVLPEPRALVRK